MHSEDVDREQIDRMVRELMTTSRPAPAPVTAAEPPPDIERRPGSRWTNVRLFMPKRRRTNPFADRLADHPAGRLANRLVDCIAHRFTIGSVAMVRIWVALGVVYSASMVYWPYPKTYFWGSVLYLMCLAVALVNGVWGARLSWDARLGAAHTLSLGTVFWAVTLAAVEAVPPGM